MQVKDHLAGAALHVEEKFVSRGVNSNLSRNLPCPENHLGNNLPVLICDLVKAADMFSRNNQEMDRGVRVSILEDDERSVFVNKFCRPLFPDDLAKKTLSAHSIPSRTVPVCIQL